MYWKHWPTWEYTILFISIIPLPALIGYHIQPRRNSVQKSPYSSGMNSCRYRRVHFCMLPLEPDINHSFFNKTPVFVSSIISWVFCAIPSKWDKCFVYLNQLKQLCVESLPCWITVYAFAITYICRVSLMINQELVWLSKLRQNGGKKIRLLYMSDTRGKNLPFVISYRILNCQGRNGPCYTYFQIGKIRLLVISFKSEGKPKII